MSSIYGENLRITIFGQSHSPAIGVTVEGIPAGQRINLPVLQAFLQRRAPGQNDWSTPRKEEDQPEFLCGLRDGFTCGAPLTVTLSEHRQAATAALMAMRWSLQESTMPPVKAPVP